MVIFTEATRPQHARRAVTTALEILRRTTELNDQLRQTFAGLSVHMGINSGPALVGPTKLHGSTGTRWTYTASGRVTNIAARITELAESGVVLVGAETFRRIAGHFVVQDLGVQPLKNVSEHLGLYRILGEVEG
jgi:class 3 adenylate cyclase